MFEVDNNPLNGMALQLVYLGIIIAVFMVMIGIVMKLLSKVIPINESIKGTLLTIAGLVGAYVWLRITFL
ncbi:hypothetical protein [Oceanobacillus sp. 1P07AA]|uniref:hypothetical protein n=1 Tax=Oceanobacillus sp. 1P07AA TaxID=3132293 RepID=UPI0039A4A71D